MANPTRMEKIIHPAMLETKKRYYNMFNAEFYRNADMLNHSNRQITNESEWIGIETEVQGKGDKCMMSDWASVTFEGFTPDGNKVYDSHDKKAFNFRVGHYEVSKCWDIAIQQMKQGEVSMISCPGILD